ncbi:hypothetical protein LINPERHAP1_LOCUS4818 [Linum perenne]
MAFMASLPDFIGGGAGEAPGSLVCPSSQFAISKFSSLIFPSSNSCVSTNAGSSASELMGSIVDDENDPEEEVHRQHA